MACVSQWLHAAVARMTTTVTRDRKPADVVSDAMATGFQMSSIAARTISFESASSGLEAVSSKYLLRI